MDLTPEEIAKAERLQAGIDEVSAKIKAAVPSAGSAEMGGLFDAYGSIEWTPSRPAGVDFSAWGDWEAWEHQNAVCGELIPSGDWVAWNSATGGMLGFPAGKAALSAREQAEMMAILQNGDRKTRVVWASGSFRASALKYRDVAAQVDPRVAVLLAASQGSAT